MKLLLANKRFWVAMLNVLQRWHRRHNPSTYWPPALIDHRSPEMIEEDARRQAQREWRKRLESNQKARAAQIKVDKELSRQRI